MERGSGSNGRAFFPFLYYRLNDPEYRGDVVGFNMRGVATPVTGKYLGAVYSPKA